MADEKGSTNLPLMWHNHSATRNFKVKPRRKLRPRARLSQEVRDD
jgi:hypothetical protein